MENVAPEIVALYRFFDLTGVFLMGIIGGTVARKNNFDVIGFLFLSLLTALGGGMIRDTLIGHGTVAAMANPEYLILAFTGALVALFTYFKGQWWEIVQFHGDAVVLGFWAVTGCVKAMNYDLPVVACVFMGVITGIGGGMIRDVVIGKIPNIFTSQQLYAVPALIAAVSMIIFEQFGYTVLGMIISPLFAIALSTLSYWRGWYIPARQDFAPVNVTASQLRTLMRLAEERGRSVGRRIEPSATRRWRHEQMEKAMERKQAREKDQQKQEEPVSAEEQQAQDEQDFEDALDLLLDQAAETDTDEQWTLRPGHKHDDEEEPEDKQD